MISPPQTKRSIAWLGMQKRLLMTYWAYLRAWDYRWVYGWACKTCHWRLTPYKITNFLWWQFFTVQANASPEPIFGVHVCALHQVTETPFRISYTTGSATGTVVMDDIIIGGLSLRNQTFGQANLTSQDMKYVTCDGIFVSPLLCTGSLWYLPAVVAGDRLLIHCKGWRKAMNE